MLCLSPLHQVGPEQGLKRAGWGDMRKGRWNGRKVWIVCGEGEFGGGMCVCVCEGCGGAAQAYLNIVCWILRGRLGTGWLRGGGWAGVVVVVGGQAAQASSTSFAGLCEEDWGRLGKNGQVWWWWVGRRRRRPR
eukprot:353268-Chlamydomonas_euryale.AAC.1